MSEPIIEFKNQEELGLSLAEWKERLFLQDWIIQAVLLECHEMPKPDCEGLNHHFNTMKACKISISKPSKDEQNCLQRHCEELTLVHELLHCKPLLTHYAGNEGSAAACYLEQAEHTMLEQMAKSLIMSKYNLPFDWFRNF